MHASWVSVVGTNGRSLFTHPMSAVAHAIGMSGYRTRGEQRPAPDRVLELALDRLPVDALEAGDGDRERDDARRRGSRCSPSVSRLISSGLTSSTPVAVAAWSRSSLSVLPRCFSPFVVAAGSAAGCTTGSTSPTRSLPSAGDRGGDRPVVADALRGGDEHRGDVAVHPELLAGRVGRAEVVERDLPVGDEDAERVELAVADARRVQLVDLAPQRREHVVGDLRRSSSSPSGVPAGGVVTSTAASGPPTPVLTTCGACTPARSARNSV